jgi:hypothetical protein
MNAANFPCRRVAWSPEGERIQV